LRKTLNTQLAVRISHASRYSPRAESGRTFRALHKLPPPRHQLCRQDFLTMRTAPQPVDQAGALRSLVLIRAALIGGVLMFGGVIWFLHRENRFPTQPADPTFVYLQIAAAIGAVVFALAWRARLAATSDAMILMSRLLICWAVGEGAGLFGAVVFLISGELRPYLIGLIAMFIVYGLTPIRRR
jgi:hypothetical protein